MTCSTVKRLIKSLDEPERELQRLRRAACYLQQNESLAPPRITSEDFTKGEIKKERHEGEKPSIIQEPAPRPSIFYQPSKSSNLPFPFKLKKQKKDDEDERLLSIFKKIHINLPFLEAMIHMPKGAMVLKDLLSHKDKHEKAASSVKLSEECSAIIQRSLPQKEGDLGSFTLPWISKLIPTKMSIQLADRSIKYPIRACENLLVKISKFTIPVDFVVLEMDEDELVLIILERPFLATERAVLVVHEGKLSLRVERETVTFNIGNLTELVEPLKRKAPANRLKSSSIEPRKLELKELPEHLEYAFLYENNQLPVVISSALSTVKKARLLEVLQNQKGEIAWSITDIKGIHSSFCTHKILIQDELKPSVQPQRRVNLNIKEVVKKEVIKLIDAGLIYPIFDSPWVSHVQVIPKKERMTVVKNEKDELIPQRTVTRWRICIDYHKLNNATRKDHFPLPFIDQMLKRLAGHEYYCFLDGFLVYFQIPNAPKDQEKTTFTCPYGTFTYKRIPFGLCNSPTTF
uniref:DNA-directed DNA polymerase n=1 Tax=Tanacetum cinerariifolium TaxID=118510 RepID=A0A6L2NW05_TANCI|nr:DNA-directed DNA polymerase [Tanacetum cinerariifolium]